MMLQQSENKLLAVILLLIPLLIGLPLLVNAAVARRRRLSEGVALADAVQPERARFHQLSIAEATSFLLLMGVAIPLKIVTHNKLWVTVFGSLHGSLFLLYIIAVLIGASAFRWRPLTLFLSFVAAVFPLGPFFFEAYLRGQEKQEKTVQSA